MNRTLAAALIALTLGPASAAAQASPSAQETPAEYAARTGDWAFAVAAYGQDAHQLGDAGSWFQYGAALAMAGDAAGAAIAFRTVASIDPAFPEIAERVASAEARAARDLDQRIDRPGFGVDPSATQAARYAAIGRGDYVFAERAAAHLGASIDLAAESATAALQGRVDRAAALSVSAAGTSTDSADATLETAEALRVSGELEAARYYLGRYVDLGGDPATAADLRRRIDRADAPRSTR